jgi:hypothetical protein
MAARQNNPRIGTEREGSLHRALKLRYSVGGKTEVVREGYVCDGISEAGDMIEVQTGSFGPLKKKIPRLLSQGPVRIIHPVILRKTIETRDRDGGVLRRRRSPRKGSAWDLFDALIHAAELPLLRGLTVELALVDALEIRVLDGRGSWRRRGASIVDRVITEYHGTLVFKTPRDYNYFLPLKAGEAFTTKSLGEKAGVGTDRARKALYVLTRLGLAERTGKSGNAYVYRKKTGRTATKTKNRNAEQ